MGRRQAVRQRTLTPSFGCSNHFAPAKQNRPPSGGLFCFFECVREVIRGWEPFCESKTLCLADVEKRPSWRQRTTLITSERGAPLKARIPSPRPKIRCNRRVAPYFLSTLTGKSETTYCRGFAWRASENGSLFLPLSCRCEETLPIGRNPLPRPKEKQRFDTKVLNLFSLYIITTERTVYQRNDRYYQGFFVIR